MRKAYRQQEEVPAAGRWRMVLCATLIALVNCAARAQVPQGFKLRSQVVGDRVIATLEGNLERPLGNIRTALIDPQHWCAVLVLHINNTGCTVVASGEKPRIHLRVARRYDLPPERSAELIFGYQTSQADPSELSAELDAPTGPFGTSDYSIRLNARAATSTQTTVELSYSYRQSRFTSAAMNLYFATLGRGKVGFTVTGSGPTGPDLIGGVRGLLERNLMRYFFAIDAAAATPVVTGDAAYEQRLRDWFAATERYPAQLRETNLSTYLELKGPLRGIGVPASDRWR